MQMNQPNQYQTTANRSYRPIPGMKLAYGNLAQQSNVQAQINKPMPQNTPKAPSQGLFGKLKDSLFNMVTEESTISDERPIGISRLSNTTFQASANPYRSYNNQASFFKNSKPIQDYRFNQLVDPRVTKPNR